MYLIPELTAKLEKLKTLIPTMPVNRLRDVDKEVILKTEGSRIAFGTLLKQLFSYTGIEYPVSFFSKALNKSEGNYSAYELKIYAVVQAVWHFCMF